MTLLRLILAALAIAFAILIVWAIGSGTFSEAGAWLMSEPRATSGSRGSPTRIDSARATRPSTNSSWSDRWTSSREPHRQI